MNITMHMPPCKVEHVTWVLDESVTPLVEVYFTSAPTVFRTVEDLAEVRRVLGEAEAELAAAQARHAAAPLMHVRLPILNSAEAAVVVAKHGWVEDRDYLLSPDLPLEPLPDLPQREPGDALDKLIDAQPQPGGTIYAELSEDALAAHAPLLSLAADDEEDA